MENRSGGTAGTGLLGVGVHVIANRFFQDEIVRYYGMGMESKGANQQSGRGFFCGEKNVVGPDSSNWVNKQKLAGLRFRFESIFDYIGNFMSSGED